MRVLKDRIVSHNVTGNLTLYSTDTDFVRFKSLGRANPF